MFLRCKMNKALKIIKNLKIVTDPNVIASFNPEVLSALKQSNCIDVMYADGGIYMIKYKSESVMYKLERSEVWIHRFLGFVSGIVTTILGKFLLELLK